MTLLVTGGTGFIGRRLVRELLQKGYSVRALVRRPARARDLEEAGAELVAGDLGDPDALRAAVEGTQGVVHLAALYDFGIDEATMRAVNVEGTRALLDAAQEAGVPRIVYGGSDTSLGDTGGEVKDEASAHPGDERSAYERTKREAHELVTARIAEGAPIVNAIISTVYGPGDESAIAELIQHHMAGRLVAHLDRSAGYTFAHVDDVATGLRLCFERGTLGRSYLLSGEPATFEEFADALASQTGIPAPRRSLPRWLRPGVFAAAPPFGPLLGKSRQEVRELLAMGTGVTRFFSGARARQELGWQPRSLEEGLADTVPAFVPREREAARRGLLRTRWILLALVIFDLLLGGTALLSPETYLALMHPEFPGGPIYWLQRTAMIWLFFAAVQAWAAWRPELPALVALVGLLRLMDVPADIVYFAAAHDLGLIGTLGLLGAPLFNLAIGLWLLGKARRAHRAERL